jgi:hypothetical protein
MLLKFAIARVGLKIEPGSGLYSPTGIPAKTVDVEVMSFWPAKITELTYRTLSRKIALTPNTVICDGELTSNARGASEAGGCGSRSCSAERMLTGGVWLCSSGAHRSTLAGTVRLVRTARICPHTALFFLI